MTEKLYKDARIIWQKGSDDGVAEKPIVLEIYTDVICLKQENQSINVNYESIDEFCKLLKSLKH